MAMSEARWILLMFVLPTVTARAQRSALLEAEIGIRVDQGRGEVRARYRIVKPGRPLVFHAPRFGGQGFFLEKTALPAVKLDTLEGLWRLRLTSGGIDSAEVELQYSLSGDLRRIPLFVPEAPTAPPRSQISIALYELSQSKHSKDRFPRFLRSSDGVWRATPDHLPSFVAIFDPPFPSVPQIAAWSVVALAIGGTVFWLLRFGLPRQRAAAAK